MRFTPTLGGALVAFALAGTAQAQPTTPPDSPTKDTPPTSCDPSKTSCPPAPTTNTNADSTNRTGANDTSRDSSQQPSSTPPTCDPAVDANCSPPLINPNTIDVPPPPPPEPAFGGALKPAPAPYTDADTAFYDRIGLGLQIGGGVDGFTNTNLRNTTNDGGSWNVRAVLGTRSPLAVEAAYIGSAQSVNALGLDNNALLVSNGVQGDLRLNVLPDVDVQPFVFGGVAWRRYDITNTRANTSDLADRDDIVEVPAGVGIAMKRYGFLAEARGEVRAAFGEDLLPARIPGSSTETMHRWGVNASIGYEF